MRDAIVETERLWLRRFDAGDAPFILQLLNEPSWIEHIGDKGVRTLDDAARYIGNVPLAMYERVGFGLYLAALKPGAEPIGMCGLIKRDGLADVDIGFAFLPAYWRQGLAREAAEATLAYGRNELGLTRIVAIVSPGNQRSAALLRRLGFVDEGTTRVQSGDELRLFAWQGVNEPTVRSGISG
jgi:ribosomal-protein-alanine N-acetyltransferase